MRVGAVWPGRLLDIVVVRLVRQCTELVEIGPIKRSARGSPLVPLTMPF